MIKVLVADDSAIARTMIKQIISEDGRMEFAGYAENGERAIIQNSLLKPDLIIMDINMPIINGIEATRKILKTSNPAIVAFTTEDMALVGYKCIGAGALEVIRKPSLAVMNKSELKSFCDRIYEIGINHKKINDSKNTKAPQESGLLKRAFDMACAGSKKYKLLVVGASTGGPAAIQTLLLQIGSNFPLPILITQHIDSLFDTHFAAWLNSTTGVKVEIAKNKTVPEKGTAYIAPSDFHLTICRNPDPEKCTILLTKEPPIHFLRPAVDKLFFSAAQVFSDKVIAVLLTGMGKDGADGCKAIFDAGGLTIAESEETCTVFGMPKAAIEEKSIKEVLPLNEIAAFLKKETGDLL
ncbi:MAG: chemotaxis-specific protein-glutamate methyltransferase CheB [Spirochaetia bacterium]|nr:chemotaxis-specific protein-glutamate methyltransferase CheB [Spirochaetia bacterium]